MNQVARGRLADVTGKDVTINPEQHYDDWASTYDGDLLDSYGYCAHLIAVNAFKKHTSSVTATIMDVGCGTGLVGRALAAAGYDCVDGVDISSQMLREAKRLDVYRQLTHLDMESTEASPAPQYDAVLSVGTFGRGHMGPSSMQSIANYAKTDGLVVLFMNAEPFIDMGFQSEIDRLVQNNVWSLIEIEDHNYMDSLERPGKLVVATKR